MDAKLIIVGAGLSGLATAYFLKNAGISALVLEASGIAGGRIRTRRGENDMPIEQGATWVFENHPSLKLLLQELNIPLFEQYREGVGLYEVATSKALQRFDAIEMSGEIPYHRIVGGTSRIIKALTKRTGPENIRYDTPIARIERKNSTQYLISKSGEEFTCEKVILCLPPRLLEQSIEFIPSLSEPSQKLRRKTHTWMADSTRFSIQYPSAFWREQGFAGMAFSACGLLREVQDHVNFENNSFALIGFMETGSPKLSAAQRRDSIIQSLCRIFGERAGDFLNYEETNWENEKLTSLPGANSGLSAHFNNGNPLLTEPAMENSLFFAGAETSELVPGYMEAAVVSAQRVSKKLVDLYHSKESS